MPRVIAILIVGLLAGNSLLTRDAGAPPALVAAILVIITGALLAHPWWGEWSIGVVAGALAVGLFFPEFRVNVELVFPVLYAAYLVSLTSVRPWRQVWLALMLLAPAGVLAVRTSELSLPWAYRPGVILALWAALGFFWLLGTQHRRRREEVTLLQEKAELAAVLERQHIAREMHDIIAHNLSGILALADGARYAGQKDPGVALDALDTISHRSREALAQMRGLLTVLRAESPRTLTAAPGTGDVAGLIAQSRAAGLEVDVRGLEDLPHLPELTQITVYRVVQEMLSNMLRHADGPGTLTFDTGRLLRIRAQNPAPAAGTPGHGLIGMRERVRAVGGTWQQEHREGTLTVTVEVPL